MTGKYGPPHPSNADEAKTECRVCGGDLTIACRFCAVRRAYAVAVRCTNCRWTGTIETSIGVKVGERHRECPNCGCTHVLMTTGSGRGW